MARAHAAIPAEITTTRHPPSQNGAARTLGAPPAVEVGIYLHITYSPNISYSIDMRFELTPYKRVLDDEEIIKDIQLVAKKHKEGYLSLSKYIRYGKYSRCAIQGHFGTWKEALIRAGLRSTRNQDELNRISNQQIGRASCRERV